MLENCHYCINKDYESGKLSENDFYEENYDQYEPATAVHDNHGIFVFYSCNNCDAEQRAKYDPIIFNDYTAYEEKAAAYGETIE